MIITDHQVKQFKSLGIKRHSGISIPDAFEKGNKLIPYIQRGINTLELIFCSRIFLLNLHVKTKLSMETNKNIRNITLCGVQGCCPEVSLNDDAKNAVIKDDDGGFVTLSFDQLKDLITKASEYFIEK